MMNERDNVVVKRALPVSNVTNANLIITELAQMAANVNKKFLLHSDCIIGHLDFMDGFINPQKFKRMVSGCIP